MFIFVLIGASGLKIDYASQCLMGKGVKIDYIKIEKFFEDLLAEDLDNISGELSYK